MIGLFLLSFKILYNIFSTVDLFHSFTALTGWK